MENKQRVKFLANLMHKFDLPFHILEDIVILLDDIELCAEFSLYSF